MESLGQYLKTIREEKQLSLEKVHNDIKLPIEQLNAIESNRLTALGNYGFAKAIVYSYVRYLEADDEMVMQQFQMMWPTQQQAAFTPRRPIKEKKMLISTNLIWLIGIVLFVIVLGVIILVSYNRGYLKRPFDTTVESSDTVRVKKPKEQEQIKPDSVRARMLKIAQDARKPDKQKEQVSKQTKTEKIKPKPDTTDYVNDLLFQSKESPFNPRF